MTGVSGRDGGAGMAAESPVTVLRGVFDPLSGERSDIAVQGRQLLAGAEPADREIDAGSWWRLPAVFDADAHMPSIATGVRAYDLYAARFGGVAQMTVALPYQLLGNRNPAPFVAELAAVEQPVITPVLSVYPTDESAGFASWFDRHQDALAGAARVCKLYTPDPNFRRNLDAVWAAGWTPAVFAYSPAELEHLLGYAHAPLHVRHATSGAAVKAVRAVPGATVQTSPHLLLDLALGRRAELAVLPTPPDPEDRAGLVSMLADIDVLGSDHVSPPVGPPTGPGLQTQQHFVPALLTVAEEHGIELADLWPKVTSGPAAVFGVSPMPGFVVVDPTIRTAVGRWPRQRDDRAPYLGRELRGRVIAVSTGDRIELV